MVAVMKFVITAPFDHYLAVLYDHNGKLITSQTELDAAALTLLNEKSVENL